jgi:hypothetical protein
MNDLTWIDFRSNTSRSLTASRKLGLVPIDRLATNGCWPLNPFA